MSDATGAMAATTVTSEGTTSARAAAPAPWAATTLTGDDWVTPAGLGGAAPHRSDPVLSPFSRIWQQQEDAWARGDGRAYAATYTPDADLVNILGERLHTRAVIAQRIQYYLDHELKNTRLHGFGAEVRFVSPTTAIILRKGCVLYGTEKACRPDTLSVNTSVAVKNSGRWLLTSFHNTLVRQQVQARPPLGNPASAGQPRPR